MVTELFDDDLSKFAYFISKNNVSWFGNKAQREKRNRVRNIIEFLWHSEEFRTPWRDELPELKFLKKNKVSIPTEEVFVVIIVGLRLYETLTSSYGWDVRSSIRHSENLYKKGDIRYKYSRGDGGMVPSHNGLKSDNRAVWPKEWHNVQQHEGTKFASINEGLELSELRKAILDVGKDYIKEIHNWSTNAAFEKGRTMFLDAEYKIIDESPKIKQTLARNLLELGSFNEELACRMWQQALYPRVSKPAVDKYLQEIKNQIEREQQQQCYRTFDALVKLAANIKHTKK